MRTLFGLLIVLFSAWGAIMVGTSSEPTPPGKTLLLWATDDTPIRRDQIELFNKLNPDLELRIDPTNRDANKVVVQSLGGVGPDLFDTSSQTLPTFVQSGIALDVTDELKAADIIPSRDFWACAGPYVEFRGRVYGVPANLDTLAVLYNKDLFEKAGVPFPSEKPSWEEIVDLGKRMTKADANGKIERFGLIFWWSLRDFFASFGAKVFSDDGTRVTIDTPEARKALNFMHDLIYVHHVAASPTESNAMASAGGWGGGNENRFVAGKAAICLGPRYFTAHFRRAGNMRVGVAPLPAVAGGGTVARGRTVAINALGRNRAASLRFLKFLAGPEYNRLNNAAADGVGAVVRYTSEPNFLFDPKFPEERSNPAWRKAMLATLPDEISPFLPNSRVDQAISLQLDLVNQGVKKPEAALSDAQRAAEKEMADYLSENQALAERHRQLTEAKK